MKKHLDLRGLSCPEPVLRTKKIIDDQAVSSVEALVDSEVNVQNLERLARSQNLFVKKEALGDHFRISINRQKDMLDESQHEHSTNSSGHSAGRTSGTSSTAGTTSNHGATFSPGTSSTPGVTLAPATFSTQAGLTRGGGTVIFIAKDTFGQGGESEKDHDFSHNLLNVFLQTISQSGLRPSTILLANSGVKLIDPTASTYKVLCDLKEGGSTVLACGLCLDYYGLKDKVAIEQITNMFAICEYLFAADQVLSP